MADHLIFINEDNGLRWRGAIEEFSQTYINAGTGNWYLRDPLNPGGSMASGAMAYEAASDGNWNGVIDKLSTAGLLEEQEVFVDVELTGSGGEDGYRRLVCRAVYHDSEVPMFFTGIIGES